jgi:hypothetical protein
MPKEPDLAKSKSDKVKRILIKSQGQSMTEYLQEMKEIKEKLNLDDNYCKKFGLLKKASVLMYYTRENEAFHEISKAVQIVKDQKEQDA